MNRKLAVILAAVVLADGSARPTTATSRRPRAARPSRSPGAALAVRRLLESDEPRL